MKHYKIPKNFLDWWSYYCKYPGTSTYKSIELAIGEDNHKFYYNLYGTSIVETYVDDLERKTILIGDR